METGLCKCGCGEKTNLAPKNDRRAGWVKGQPLRFKRGHQTKGRSFQKVRIDPGPEKECVKCKESRPIEEFGKRSDKKDGRESWCRHCQRRLTRDYSLRKKYGVTLDQYEQMCEEQNFCCKICGRKCMNERGNRRDVLVVDHCHDELHIRGLLCFDCNVGLGHFRDNSELLEIAIKYLKGLH